MNPFDIFIILVLGYSIVRGLFRGLVKEVSSIIGVIGGFYAAYSYYPMVGKLLSGIIEDTSYLNILSFLIIFCGILLVISILGVVIKYLLNVAFLGWIDRFCGVGFGLIKGVLIVTVIFIILTTFLSKGTPLIKKSILAPHVIWISEKMVGLVSEDMKKDFFDKLNEFKKAWKIQK
jgi:membrane protein required for colicin V production